MCRTALKLTQRQFAFSQGFQGIVTHGIIFRSQIVHNHVQIVLRTHHGRRIFPAFRSSEDAVVHR